MQKNIQQILAELHSEAKTYQFAMVAEKLRQVLQRAKMTEPMLLQVITPEDEKVGSGFWWTVLMVKFPTPREVVVKSAHAYCAVIYCAGQRRSMLSMREQARQYCDHIAEVCEEHLQKHAAELKALPPPSEKLRPKLTVHEGGRR